MTVWIDAQLPPVLAAWLTRGFGVAAVAVRDLGLRDVTDLEIFHRALQEKAVVLSKDADFAHLVQEHGAPPQIIWLTCGNTSNARLQQLLSTAFPWAQRLLQAGESLVEIGDAPPARTGA